MPAYRRRICPSTTTKPSPAPRRRLQFIALLAGVIVAAQIWPESHAGAAPVTRATGALDITVELERPLVVQGHDEALYVLVTLTGAERRRPAGERPPLNLSMVLDRSGSMEDKGKIGYLREAAQMGVGLLAPTDSLSLIAYDDRITVLRPAGPVEDPDAINQLIGGLTPRGSTNLTGGMMAGVDQVKAWAERDRQDMPINRVLLLSDGLANQGITDPDRIRARVRDAKAAGVRISTLGLGRDYDEDLMQMIAEQGGGAYYYIENPRQMGRIFEAELSALFATVAKSVRLDFAPDGPVTGYEVVSLTDAYAPVDGAVALPDFYAGEERRLVLRLSLDAPPDTPRAGTPGRIDLGTLTVGFEDMDTGAARRQVIDLSTVVVASAEEAERARSRTVAAQLALLRAEQAQKAALKLYEEGAVDAAQQVLDDTESRLRADPFTADLPEVTRKLEALEIERQDMAAFAAEPAAAAGFLKRSKQRLYQAQTGVRKGFTLKAGDDGLEVERLQQALKDTGHYDGPVTGDFDDATQDALTAFQSAEGLDADGIAGPSTLKALGLY